MPGKSAFEETDPAGIRRQSCRGSGRSPGGSFERWFSYPLHQRGRNPSEKSAGRNQTVFRRRRALCAPFGRTGGMGNGQRHAGGARRTQPRDPPRIRRGDPDVGSRGKILPVVGQHPENRARSVTVRNKRYGTAGEILLCGFFFALYIKGGVLYNESGKTQREMNGGRAYETERETVAGQSKRIPAL